MGVGESYCEGMVLLVLLYDVRIAMVVPANVVAFADSLVVPTADAATSAIVTDCAVGQMP